MGVKTFENEIVLEIFYINLDIIYILIQDIEFFFEKNCEYIPSSIFVQK
jgi:hypothetical protein